MRGRDLSDSKEFPINSILPKPFFYWNLDSAEANQTASHVRSSHIYDVQIETKRRNDVPMPVSLCYNGLWNAHVWNIILSETSHQHGP